VSHERLRMPTPTGEVADGYQAFALPAVFGEHLPMVDLRFRTGERIGFSYAWLTMVKMHTDRIELSFTTGTLVMIRGRNLSPVYGALVNHQAVYIHEADTPTASLVPSTVPLVDGIEVKASA
jgi:hypothetical protein